MEHTEQDFKGYDCLNNLLAKDENFRKLIIDNINLGKIRYFGEEEWNIIKSQNYMCPHPLVKDFYDIFRLGFNEGNCTGCARQLSYSYNNIYIAGGGLPILIGTRNCPIGSHTWLETDTHIIDTSLLLVIDKSLKDELGYQTENIYGSDILNQDPLYRARREWVLDQSIKSAKL